MNKGLMLFLLGLFSMTKINLGGSLAIAELVVVCMTPFVLPKCLLDMKRDGMSPLLTLSLLWLCGAIFADIYNSNYIALAVKGIATPIVYFCSFVCMYSLLQKDLKAVKWFVLGVALSYVVSTFVFQRASSIGLEMSADDALEATLDYKLYWIGFADKFLLLPVRGWFINTPLLYCLLSVGGLAIFSLATGGRSSFAAFAVSLLLIYVGKSSRNGGFFIRKHFITVCVVLMCILVGVKNSYEYAVKKGFLGEAESKKYEAQTKGGNSPLQMIMAGRVEFFVDLYAAAEHPLLGRGSWALDYDGLFLQFLYKYGDEEDYARANKIFTRKLGTGVARIPAHSHVMTFWMWHGMFGLFFWIYVIYLLVVTLIRNLNVEPALFGYLALAIPIALWDILFSPAGYRVSEAVLFVLCVLANAKSKQFRLGYDEIRRC